MSDREYLIYRLEQVAQHPLCYDASVIREAIAALSHAAGQEQCRAASGLADHEACALVDRLIDAVWDEANSAHKGTTGECVNAAKETERVKHELLRTLSRGVPEGE